LVLDGRVSANYGIQSIPTTFILDRDGMIILRLVGSIDWNTPKIHAALESLLSNGL
jgi:thioredoxin-related protein